MADTNIRTQPPRGFGPDEEDGDPPHASETESAGERGHVECRHTSVLRVQAPVARDAPFRDSQGFPSYGLTPCEVYPEVLGGTCEYSTGEQSRPQSPEHVLPDFGMYGRETGAGGSPVSVENVQDA